MDNFRDKLKTVAKQTAVLGGKLAQTTKRAAAKTAEFTRITARKAELRGANREVQRQLKESFEMLGRLYYDNQDKPNDEMLELFTTISDLNVVTERNNEELLELEQKHDESDDELFSIVPNESDKQSENKTDDSFDSFDVALSSKADDAQELTQSAEAEPSADLSDDNAKSDETAKDDESYSFLTLNEIIDRLRVENHDTAPISTDSDEAEKPDEADDTDSSEAPSESPEDAPADGESGEDTEKQSEIPE